MTIDRYSLSFSRTASLLLAVAILSCSTGCANLGGLPGFSLRSTGDTEPVSPHGVCKVEIHDGGKPEIVSVPLTPESRVQSVLDESSASGRFKRMKTYVVRKSPRNPEEDVRLASSIDSDTGKVTLETDYAIVDGDRLIVVEDKTTKLDRAIDAILPF